MNENFSAKPPEYKGDGIAIWINTDKNGQKFLSVKILGSITINCFKNEPKKLEIKTANQL